MSYGDEYYCPNCGANLNDQYGFDPDKGTWTCTNCGEHLMDDDVYEGDSFEGVAWYCDDCGALLNRQDGFSDSYGSWTCSNCGHVNGTTEDDIINGGPECPSCGAKLKTQWSYNEWSNDHTCADCGANLHRDYSSDDFEVVEEEEDDSLKCPNCSARLKDQWGYSEYDDDWTCTECDARLHHDYSSEEYEIVEEDDDDSEETTHSSYSSSGSSYAHTDSSYRSSDRSYTSSGSSGHTRTTSTDSTETSGFRCPSCGANLSKQHNFDYRNEEYTCKVCHTLLYHYYTDEAFKIKRERARSSSDTSSSHSSTSYRPTPPHTPSYSSDSSHRSSPRRVRTGPNEWLIFLVCLFFGYFGVHKFMEGKTGMGILYIFTVGLFGIGWMVDCCTTFMKAVKTLF